jgi:hypothetical protein
MTKPPHIVETEAYVDGIFGQGTGEAHVRFLERIQNPALREMLHRYHTLEGDTCELSLVENYLIGVCVLCAQRDYTTAALFTKVLMHLGARKEKILAALARLSMWIGGVPAAEASLLMQRAIREYEREGLASLAVWFPEESAR